MPRKKKSEQPKELPRENVEKIGFEPPKKEKPVSVEAEQYKDKTQRMKEHLDAQPKISFLIPLVSGEKEGAFETVCLNGHMLVIKKGVMVELPKQVAEILAESYKIQMEAGKEMLLGRSKEVKEALS